MCCVASWGSSGATREVGCPEMHKDWVVCAFVSLIEAQLVVGERVDPVLVDEPVEWSAWHAQESCTIHIVPFRASGSLERRRS